MNKNRICYILRSLYPEFLGIRKRMQVQKIKRLYRHTLPADITDQCESNPQLTNLLIEKYITKWKKYLIPSITEMEDILVNSPQYKERKNKDAIRTDMLFCRLAYGFFPSEYACFEFENKTPAERKEFMSDIDTNSFGYSVNNLKLLQKFLDKGDCAEHFKELFKREFVIIETKRDYTKFNEFVKKHPCFVEKKVFSSMGRGTRLVDISRLGKSKDEYFDELIKGDRYLLEEIIVQKKEMEYFNTSSVNTVRCMTFKTNAGVVIPYTFMRSGRRGSFVDNGGSGGLVIGIDPKTGIINTDGYDEYNTRYEKHPDSGVKFIGYQIPEWTQLTSLCLNAAEQEKGMGYLSWDLAFTEKGWVIVEVNEVGQFIGPQMTTKCGIKREVSAYLNHMEKVY